MRRFAIAASVIAYLTATTPPVAADSPDATSGDPDPNVTVRAPSGADPWIDRGPVRVLEPRPEPASHRKRNAAIVLGGLYAGFMTWTYIAWYRKEGHAFRAGGDTPPDKPGYYWFSNRTYAAGADKLGHAWATLGLARWGTELLNQYGGYSRLSSAIVGTALSEALFLGVEIKDGYHYAFSYGDLTFNTLGAGLAFAQSMWPALDDAIDFRVEYYPSEAFRKKANADVAEDYSGQTYLLAFHLGSIPALHDGRFTQWSRYLDVVGGFDSRGYKPDPPYTITEEMPDYDKQQRFFLGVSLNAQGIFDDLLRNHRFSRKIAHGLSEMFNIPGTSVPILEKVRVPIGAVPNDGA